MSLSAANLAAMHAKMQEAIPRVVTVRCLTLYALLAAKLAKFLSSRGTTVLCIAANALQRTELNFQKSLISVRLSGRTFFIVFSEVFSSNRSPLFIVSSH
jgi:hypothetical protein